VYLLDEPSLFSLQILNWNWFAVPYFVLLGILAGINSVFLTKCVLFCKSFFSKIERNYTKILLAAVLIGGTLFLFPELYGDGYHGIQDIVQHPNSSFSMSFLFSILGILLLKPIITAVTLGAGGDGGVFAPSLVIGGFLGFFVATFLNTFFGTNVLPINFIIIGMAALLSASIHAPFTSIFLVCGLVNDYTLFFPLLLVCLVSKYTAKSIYPYTVYSFAIRTV
jgi:CIC family chloride channel protein